MGHMHAVMGLVFIRTFDWCIPIRDVLMFALMIFGIMLRRGR